MIEQVPIARMVTVLAETVQTDNVVEVKLTGRFEVAVAVAANGAIPKLMPLIGANTMVWEP